MHGEVFNEKETVLKNFEDAGFETEAEIIFKHCRIKNCMIGTVLINHKRKISPFDKGYPILMPVYINETIIVIIVTTTNAFILKDILFSVSNCSVSR